MSSPILKPLRTIPGLQIHYANKNLCLGSRGLGLYGSNDYGVNWRRYGVIPSTKKERWLHLFAPYQRLIRGGVTCGIRVADGHDEQTETDSLEDAAWILMSGGMLYLMSENGQRVEPFWQLHNGRRTLHRGICFLSPNLYIGDYWANPERQPVSLYEVNVTTKEERIFYQFSAGSVRHIHNVEIDPFTGRLWISTGDEDHECQICHFDVATGKRKLLGEGSQQWRAVSFTFQRDAIYWGTDNPLGINQIWRYDRISGNICNIGTVQGPIYYSKSMQSNALTNHTQEDNNQKYIVFGTAVEFGNGQQDQYGRLYAASMVEQGLPLSTDSISLKEVYRQPKDNWHKRYFGYSVFELNAGDVGQNRFWATHKGFQGGLRSILFEVCSL